jgi:hypothetical protein
MANFNTPFLGRRNGLDEEAAAGLARFAQDQPNDVADSQDNKVSQGEYLRNVLNGTSLVDIVEHGMGPFEDKTVHFQPSGFGVVCILNVRQHNVASADLGAGLVPPHVR